MTDKQRIAFAFRDLRKQGIYARMKFWCCQSCACADLEQRGKTHFVFYHQQDAEAFNRYGDLREYGMHIAFGELEDAHALVKALNAHGLPTEWDGTQEHRVRVRTAVVH